MNNDAKNCQFCQPEDVLFGNDLAYAKPDKFSVNPGRLPIIPRRHVADFFLTTGVEKGASHRHHAAICFGYFGG